MPDRLRQWHDSRVRSKGSPPTLEALESRCLLSGVSTPDHVVIVMEENRSYSSIIGYSGAPYLNSLAAQGAVFTNSFGVTHPSQPNYIALFSGLTQGVTDDLTPYTFSTPNLGSELIAAGRTFKGYSETMPSVGYTGDHSGQYWRKHNPWVNFTNVPTASNQPLTAFPTDFTKLPTVSFVIPNQDHDMHDGSRATADSWLKSHLDPYVKWAQTHNSMLIVQWDEDDLSSSNQIPTIFVGPMVKPGKYAERIDHYNVLRTVQDMYGLAPIANSATAAPIRDAFIQPTDAGLRLTELMYLPANPPSGSPYTAKDFEYVEVQNISAKPLDVGGVKVADGIDFEFPSGYTIQSGQYALAVSNQAAFTSRYGSGLPIAGQYTRNLNDLGELISLLDPAGQPIVSFTYSNTWYPTTAGSGASLVKLNPETAASTTWNQSTGWRASASASPGGSPGTPEPPPDSTAPTAAIVGVTPNPRQAPVDSVSINFSEAVNGFDLSDLRLTRSGTIVPLTDAALSASDATHFTLSSSALSEASAVAGTYVLTLTASGSGIQDASGNLLAANATTTWQNYAAVTGRMLFYNNSKFDGFDPAANSADDAAIATDKDALLPGSQASFVNYSNYANGINGIAIDVAGLPIGPLTAADFELRSAAALNANVDPATWTLLSQQKLPTVTLRRGAGIDGSDRLELTWADGSSVKNAWLRVAVKATANTGFQTPDVFYFGNAVGETGNSAGDAFVNSNDYYSTRDHLSAWSGAAPITSHWDFNRDGVVDLTDIMIVRANATTSSTALQLISPAATASALPLHLLDAASVPSASRQWNGANSFRSSPAKWAGSLRSSARA